MNTYTSEDIGCYYDGARGVYIGEAVQELAASHGWTGVRHEPDDVRPDSYWWAWDEAEEYLNDLADNSVYFGSNEGGDWGLWAVEDDS